MKTVKWVGVLPSRQAGPRNVVRHLENGSVEPLPPCNNLVNHSPDGFHWGYNGSGPAQLSFAIMYDYFKDADKARKWYQKFKFKVISQFPQEGSWVLTHEEVEAALVELKNCIE